MKTNQKGFSIVELLIIVIVIGLLGGTGWYVYTKNNKTTNSTTSVGTNSTSKTTPTPIPTLESTPKADPNEGYLVVKEWGLRFKVPSGLTDVRYSINDETAAFFAKPKDSSVQYRTDYDKFEDGSFRYATGILYRSKNSQNTEMMPVDGKKVGDYYYYTAWSFSGLATGAACLALYGDSSDGNCQAGADAFRLVNQDNAALLKTIELAL